MEQLDASTGKTLPPSLSRTSSTPVGPEETPINMLHKELLGLVLANLDTKDLLVSGLVSKFWNAQAIEQLPANQSEVNK